MTLNTAGGSMHVPQVPLYPSVVTSASADVESCFGIFGLVSITNVKAHSQPGPLGPPARCSDEDRGDHGSIHHCKIIYIVLQGRRECKSLI